MPDWNEVSIRNVFDMQASLNIIYVALNKKMNQIKKKNWISLSTQYIIVSN